MRERELEWKQFWMHHFWTKMQFFVEARIVVLTFYFIQLFLFHFIYFIVRQHYFLQDCILLNTSCFVRHYIQKSVGCFICLLFYRECTIKKEENDTSSHTGKRQKGKHIDTEIGLKYKKKISTAILHSWRLIFVAAIVHIVEKLSKFLLGGTRLNGMMIGRMKRSVVVRKSTCEKSRSCICKTYKWYYKKQIHRAQIKTQNHIN